jgi:hypothetical protein
MKYPPQVQAEALEFDGLWAELSQFEDLEQAADPVPRELVTTLDMPVSFSAVIRSHLERGLSEGALGSVIPWLSGVLPLERDVLEGYLCEHASEIDDSWRGDLERLDQIFTEGDADEGFLRFLKSALPVPEPEELSPDAEWDAVKQWFEHAYVPFHTWARSLGRMEETERSARAFEQWLLDNYDELSRTEAYAPYAARDILSSLVAKSPVLLIVADALSWEQSIHLRSLLLYEGTKHGQLTMHVGSIPTVTAVAKPALLRGQLPSQVELKHQGTGYYAALLAEMLNLTQSDVGSSSSSEKALPDLLREKKRVYLYLFNEIDHHLHRQLSLQAREEQIALAMNHLASAIGEARDVFKSRYGQALAVVIESDHGYTELPESSRVRLIDPPDGNCWEGHARAICYDRETDVGTDDLVRVPGYGPTQVFLVARGYACIGSRPKGATHGAMTPQEVFVPAMVFDPTDEVAYREPEVAILGEIRRGKAGNPVTVRLWNHNATPIEVTELRLRNVVLEKPAPFSIEASGPYEIKALFDATPLRRELFTITGALTVEVRGAEHSTEIRHDVRTTGAAVTDDAFEDAFDV